MEHSRFNRGPKGISGALIIVRDTLIFMLCMLISVLMLVEFLPNRKAAATTTEASSQQALLQSNEDLAAQNQVVIETISLDALSQESSADASVQNETTQKASAAIASDPVPASPETIPQQAPVATGDFSATFPKEDTGTGALLSHQSDTVRIAIQKQQAYGATYFVADVWVKDITSLRTAFAKKAYGNGREMPVEVAKEAGAVFAVTGDYYGARKEGVVVRNGKLYRDVMSDDICILKTDGTLAIYQKGSFSVLEAIDETVWQAWAFGPALVENGAVCDVSKSRIKVKNPRSAIGYYAPGHYCFIVVDGRQKDYSEGMSLDELAKTFAALGCQTAYNLDGGATAMMVFEGALVNQPVNGGRSSSDIICFS